MDPLLPIPEYYEAELEQARLQGKLAMENCNRAKSAGGLAVTPEEYDQLWTASQLAGWEIKKAEAVLAFVQKYSPAALRVLERQ